jgi:hypothetical protein
VRYLIGRVGGLGLDHDADEWFRPHAAPPRIWLNHAQSGGRLVGGAVCGAE